MVLRFGGLRTTSNDGGGFLEGLNASSSREVRLEVFESVEVSVWSAPNELREPNALKRDKVLLVWTASERGGVSASALRSESVEGKFLILMRSVDSFLLGLRSVSTPLPCGATDGLKLDMTVELLDR